MLSKISRFRTEIMGVAILWIMAFHSKINLPNFLAPLKIVTATGYGAVDIFFFLSGFGLFCGWRSGNQSIVDFYKSRVSRVLPAYLIATLLYAAFTVMRAKPISSLDLLAMLTGFNFFLYGHMTFWFVPAILAFYLAFPVLVIFNRFNRPELIASSEILLALFVSVAISMTNLHYLLIFTARLPIFILGIFAGFVFVNNIRTWLFDDIKWVGMCLSLGGVLLAGIVFVSTTDLMWRYGFWWYPFLLMAYPICLILAVCLEWVDKFAGESSYVRPAYGFLSYCGTYSLEIYLLHVIIYAFGPVGINELYPMIIRNRFNIGNVPEYAIYSVLAITSARPFSRAASRLFHPCFK